jgi:hypothetical protein
MCRDWIRSTKRRSNGSGMFLRRILGMALAAVETVHNRLAKNSGIGGIAAIRQAFGQVAQLARAKLAFRVEAVGKSNDLRLLLLRQMFDFLDYLCRSHGIIIRVRSGCCNA